MSFHRMQAFVALLSLLTAVPIAAQELTHEQLAAAAALIPGPMAAAPEPLTYYQTILYQSQVERFLEALGNQDQDRLRSLVQGEPDLHPDVAKVRTLAQGLRIMRVTVGKPVVKPLAVGRQIDVAAEVAWSATDRRTGEPLFPEYPCTVRLQFRDPIHPLQISSAQLFESPEEAIGNLVRTYAQSLSHKNADTLFALFHFQTNFDADLMSLHRQSVDIVFQEEYQEIRCDVLDVRETQVQDDRATAQVRMRVEMRPAQEHRRVLDLVIPGQWRFARRGEVWRIAREPVTKGILDHSSSEGLSSLADLLAKEGASSTKAEVGQKLGPSESAKGKSTSAAGTTSFGRPAALADVPPRILAAASQATGLPTWTTVLEFPQGYKLIGRNLQQREVVASVTHEGQIAEVQFELSLDRVPSAIRSALETHVPGFTITHVRAAGRSLDAITYYNVRGRMADGTSRGFEVTVDGARVQPQ